MLSHYYRDEISRMISWRERIDLTTNWAIGVVAGIVVTLLACHAGMIWTMLVHRETPGELAHGDVHV